MQLTKLSFNSQCLLALVVGILAGYVIPVAWINVLTPIGTAFLQLLKMITMPLAFVLIVCSFTRLENLANIKRLGSKTFFGFLPLHLSLQR